MPRQKRRLCVKILGGQVIAQSGQRMPISGAVESDGLIFTAGQLSVKDGRLQGDTAGEQLMICIDNIERILQGEGLGLDNVVKATLWVTQPEMFADVDAAYALRFSAPFPARSVVVSGLVVPGALVEIEVVASRTGTRCEPAA
jgi:2-iminobutanoate/2-iminopropanoate deaminase